MSKNGLIYKLGELFCGPGGLAYGALHASVPGAQIVHEWATDYDESTCKTYIKNICPNNPESVICKDIRLLEMDSLSEIDGLAFGFPCNDYSIVGESKGLSGSFGPLYKYGVKALKKFKPKWFVAENVGGLRSANGGSAIKQIFDEFLSCGYRLYPNLYKFEEYGIPQCRHRIIIVGIRRDIGVDFKVPSTKEYSDLDNSAKKAITDPPIPQEAKNNEIIALTKTVADRLSLIRPGRNAFNTDLPETLQLHCGRVTLSQIYKRIEPNKPSYTVTGSGGGGTHMYHWVENRALTNREKARLQTFPDSFEFIGTKTEVRKQVGMAVPCKGAQIIFEALLKTLLGVSYPSMEANMPNFT